MGLVLRTHLVSPLLDDAHLDLDDCVVAGHEPGVELLQHAKAGLHSPVPHVNQLGPAVDGGQGPPIAGANILQWSNIPISNCYLLF